MQHAFDFKISGSSQLRIMRLIWEYGYRTPTEICSHLEDSYPIHANTANTILNRLAAKGILHRESGINGQGNQFTPLLTKEEYAVLLFQAMVADVGLEDFVPQERSSQTNVFDINGPTELGMMLFIWEQDGCTKTELAAASASWRSEPLTYSSVTVTLRELERKGLARFEMARRKSQRCCIYLPTLTKLEYLRSRFYATMNSLQLTPEAFCYAAFQTPAATRLLT